VTSPANFFPAKLFALGKKLVKFSAGQSALQLLQALNGLALVWLLPINDFAMYALFTGAMGFSAVLFGLGLTPTLISLVGSDVRDPATVGRYMFAAFRLRLSFLAPATFLGVCFLIYSGGRLEGSWGLVALLCLSLLTCNIFAAQTDLYGAPLQMAGRLGALYKWSLAAELVKLLLVLVLWTGEWLTAASASISVLVALGVNFLGLRWAAGSHFQKPATVPLKEREQLWHITKPLLPNVLFSAMQGQITIVVAALVGTATQIASVGALGRLARLIAFLQAANPMLVGPALAKLKPEQLWRALPLVIGVTGLVAAAIAVSGFVLPDVLILLLGTNYRDLGDVVWLVTLGAGLGYFVSVLTTITLFRHWVAWWSAFASIGLVVAMQIGVASTADLRTVAGALLLGIAADVARIIIVSSVLTSARWRPGWLRDPRRIAA